MTANTDAPELRTVDSGEVIKGVVVRGKYLESFRSGTNVVLLHPDVAKAFPTEEAVNNALRSILDAGKRPGKIS